MPTVSSAARTDGSVDFASGTLAAPGRPPRALGPADFQVAATGRWRDADGASYPAGWRVEIPSAGLALEVRPLVAGAVNRSRLLPGLAYWEGPVEVRSAGAAAGEGYVELTGYGPGGRLPL